MKRLLNILTLGLIFFFSCKNVNEKKNSSISLNDTNSSSLDKKAKEQIEELNKIKEQDKIDSIRLENILIEAIKISNKNIDKDTFQTEYEITPDTEYRAKVKIKLGYYFSDLFSHLIIRREVPGSVLFDIYAKQNGKFEKVISLEQGATTYVSDTIRDINGDRLKDFVVNWYGNNGCCLKAFSAIYILRTDKKSFSNSIEFINPTFSPAEKIIRGVCYGHPGETEMYKYKWAGEKIDTLEYVSFEKNEKDEKTGKIIISDKEPYEDRSKVLKHLNIVPKEYKKIEGYDWFMGAGY